MLTGPRWPQQPRMYDAMTDPIQAENASSEGTSDSPCWPKRIGNMVRVRFNNATTLSAPLASLHITWGDDGWISIWCNGTGMGQVDKEQAERIEYMMATASIEIHGQ